MDSFSYIVNHIFLPPQLPQEDDDQGGDQAQALCLTIRESLKRYIVQHVSRSQRTRWIAMLRMMRNLCEAQSVSEHQPKRSVAVMQPGDVVARLIRAQNAGVILRQSENRDMVFEAFEASPPDSAVMGAEGKLLCSYPGPAITVPSVVAQDPAFQKELALFLSDMNSIEIQDALPATKKAGSTVTERRDTTHPRYITQLLTGILRGLGSAADVTRIQKRVADDVQWSNAYLPWRRSALWLVIRVALQTSLYSEKQHHQEYKSFMVFLMAGILRKGVTNALPSDLLFYMRAKVSRRLYKIGPTASPLLIQQIREVNESVDDILRSRWSLVQAEQASSAYWAPHQLDVHGDTRLSLHNSKERLEQTIRGVWTRNAKGTFHPREYPRPADPHSFVSDYGQTLLDLTEAIKTNPSYVALADLECWILENLENWVYTNIPNDCDVISACITAYYASAESMYRSNPEDQSIMLLTLFELWITLDRLAVVNCPLLLDYSPEVTGMLLEPLLLRRSKYFDRVARIRQYVGERRDRATCGSIFTDEVDSKIFAVRYFDGSRDLATLMASIEADARLTRGKKREELLSKNVRHRDLTALADGLDHTYFITHRGWHMHDRYCKKCSYEKEADSLTIAIYEWPLPSDHLRAKAVVFELRCPPVFQVWRTTTYKLLRDICTPHNTPVATCDAHVILCDYSGLTNYIGPDSRGRISLASTEKSFGKTHYKGVKIPSTVDSVLLNNGLKFRLHDKEKNQWAANPFANCNVSSRCTMQLPPGPYTSLQYAVSATSHTSNEILANQSSCPADLSLHEYTAFGSIRAGPRLQWLNIAREIAAQTLSVNREEVHILLTQAAWQLGPPSDGGNWDHHEELSSPDFGIALLNVLGKLINDIEANWVERVSVRTAIALISRLLSSTTDQNVIEKAYDLLRKARYITFTWMHQLAETLEVNEDESAVDSFQMRVCEVAATCRATYDVDPLHTPFLLDTVEDVSIFVRCAIAVHENSPAYPDGAPLDLKRLCARDRRLAHSTELLLSQRIRENRDGLDAAIASIWGGYRRGPGWKQLDKPNHRWWSTTTSSGPGQASQDVHVNLLDGQLLVDGKPLGRLPRNISKHSMYLRVLGNKILDIIPSDIPNMEYATRNLIFGYQIHFSLLDGENLTLRTIREASDGARVEVLDLLPHHIFTGDLPTSFIDDAVHWINVSTREVEFRPLSSPWLSSEKNWRMCLPESGLWMMKDSSSRLLVDVRSPTFAMIFASLEGLEARNNVVVTSGEPLGLCVELPRFRLSFVLNNGLLHSRNFPGMVVDEDQSSGTMFGLCSQLILRPNTKLTRPRRVIIPQGEVKFSPLQNHVTVSIDTARLTRVLYHDYEIDTNLGRLVGNGTMMSHYFRAYLHAVTGHCLPDPLTSLTGTEEALGILRSASCRSFQRLNKAEVDVLRKISGLTPMRTWYPHYLKVMQQVQWCRLAPTRQHDGFRTAVQSITDHAERLQMFYDSPDDLTFESPGDAHLLDRAARRSAFLYSSEFAGDANSHSQDNADAVYTSRDVADDEGMQNEAIIRKFSHLVYLQPSRMDVSTEIFEVARTWGTLVGDDPLLELRSSQFWEKRDLGKIWLPLYNKCRQSSSAEIRFQLVFSLSSLAYTSPAAQPLIPTILAFAIFPEFRLISPPLWHNYDLSQGWAPQVEKLKHKILAYAYTVSPFDQSPEARLPANAHEALNDLATRRRTRYDDRLNTEASDYASLLIEQWPSNTPFPPPIQKNGRSWSFNSDEALEEVEPLLTIWHNNLELRDHLVEVQSILDGHRASPEHFAHFSSYQFSPCSSRPASHSNLVTYDYIFNREAPSVYPPPNIGSLHASSSRRLQSYRPLEDLVSEFRDSPSSAFHRRYGEGLAASLQSLVSDNLSVHSAHQPYTQEHLIIYHLQCKKHYLRTLHSVQESLSPSTSTRDQRDTILFTAGLWPPITIRALLRRLSSCPSTEEWERTLISLAEALLRLQQAQRLLSYCLLGRKDEFSKEAANSVRNWDATHCLDWLIIQIEGNFLARSVQIDTAEKMMTPLSGENSILQLNMGEGKSSVIVPMAAASLADGQKLVRVVVLKPLLNQMFRLLVDRLGGLANRPVFYAPFSRAVQIGPKQAHLIQSMYEECMRVRGVLVVQPEHLLSFKLMGINRRLCTATIDDVSRSLLRSQEWLERNSRDILDESDEILHVKYQLVYTLGQSRRLEHHPHRWAIIQDVFARVQEHARQVQMEFPSGLEIQQERGPNCGRFARIRILQRDAGITLTERVADDAMDGKLPYCPQLRLFHGDLHKAARDFITRLRPSLIGVSLLRKSCGEDLWMSLLLLRAVLAHGILNYVLRERRWRVDYGLDLSRSLLAVPYRAKDVPAIRAEFGHPDVCLALTCLSYYYGGLSETQLDTCFDLLSKLDNPDQEYEKWVHNNGRVHDSLRDRRGVNVQDASQRRDHLQPAFLKNHAVIDFFLSSVVFPKEAKEFQHKLVTSGWDVAERKHHVTTGFSGTNDNRYLLPTSISQLDDPKQQSTNARVLGYVLQPENDFYERSTSAESLLELIIRDQDIHVLLDVGAQMLDVSNSALAERWLSRRPHSSAVIYFGDDDDLVVRSRDGTIEPFISSPFSKRLHESEPKCLVYLDDAHTRGTDLKLPETYCAAVTLGPKVTKDRLVQGCMRMRLLGHGQSVKFFAPLEVDRAIRNASCKGGSERISASDVLRWAMLESCTEIQHFLPHWREQGIQYTNRHQAWLAFSSSDYTFREVLDKYWREAEGRSLEMMYGSPILTHSHDSPSLNHPAADFSDINGRYRELAIGAMRPEEVRMEEEQEREIDHEVERERQVERPPKAEAMNHFVHPDVRSFVQRGIIPPNSKFFVPLFSPLARIEARIQHVWSSKLFSTKDFAVTIRSSNALEDQDFLRPVNWIASNLRHELVVLSPFEVNALLPEIRQSKMVHLHIYAPRTTQSMRSFDDLKFHCIPSLPRRWVPPESLLVSQLNLWAGQLYLRDSRTYLELCQFLGIDTPENRDDNRVIRVQRDGFVLPKDRGAGTAMQALCGFTESPIHFIAVVAGLRRKGMSYLSSHVGKLVHASLVTERDFTEVGAHRA